MFTQSLAPRMDTNVAHGADVCMRLCFCTSIQIGLEGRCGLVEQPGHLCDAGFHGGKPEQHARSLFQSSCLRGHAEHLPAGLS